MLKFLNKILDWFFYKKCYFCSSCAENILSCNKCLEKIKLSARKRTKTVNGIKIHGYFLYSSEIKKLVRAVKYHQKKDFAGFIAKILFELMEDEGLFSQDIELIPVPLHQERQKQRKYNHMEIISDELAGFLGCAVNTGIVKRVKNTIAQYYLSKQERKENLNGAFSVSPEGYSGKTLVLFDDICTTGSTIEEIVNELRKNGIYNIEGLVISFAN